jgi:hypothetical protein
MGEVDSLPAPAHYLDLPPIRPRHVSICARHSRLMRAIPDSAFVSRPVACKPGEQGHILGASRWVWIHIDWHGRRNVARKRTGTCRIVDKVPASR